MKSPFTKLELIVGVILFILAVVGLQQCTSRYGLPAGPSPAPIQTP